MLTVENLFNRLWKSYVSITPQAPKIEALFRSRGDRVVNDHVALRTFDNELVGLDVLDKAFLEIGYEPISSYEFPEKKLFAYHYEHKDRVAPKVFISALRVNELSKHAAQAIEGLIGQVAPAATVDPFFVASGRPWDLDFDTYKSLLEESEYAAWVAAFGFRANHFTVSVNELDSISALGDLNTLLKDNGYPLNSSGGEIKGGKDVFLAQSSTLASKVSVEFSDQSAEIPSCYYEFAERFPGPDGSLFQGFVAGSADRIFESTNSHG